MIRFALMLLAATLGMSAVRGFSQEANTEAKAAVVEKNSGKTAKDDQ